jgi:hypothetical protein
MEIWMAAPDNDRESPRAIVPAARCEIDQSQFVASGGIDAVAAAFTTVL